MIEVIRFEFASYPHESYMTESPDGEYVAYEDYSALQQKLDALAAENAALKELATGYADLADSRLSEMTANCESDCRRECYEACNKTPATAAYLNSVRAEGIYFAANRMLAAWDSGFIDDTPAQAYDISGAVLSAVELLPNASSEEFKRDFADSIRREIKASAGEAK